MSPDTGTGPRETKGAARRTGPALEAMFRFIVWLVPTLDKFPRSQKFLLGDRIQAGALDVLERLIEATYSRVRERALGDAKLGLENLRHPELRRYEYAARTQDEIGQLLGRWIIANRAAQA